MLSVGAIASGNSFGFLSFVLLMESEKQEACKKKNQVKQA